MERAPRSVAAHDEAKGFYGHAELPRSTWSRSRAQEKLDPRDFGLRYLFFSGEPGASVPGVKDRIEEALWRRASSTAARWPR